MSSAILNQVVEKLASLPDDLQGKVLEFVQTLTISAPQGVPGSQLLRFAGAFPARDVQTMGAAIEAGCEQV